MNNYQTEMQKLVDDFVDQLGGLWQRALSETLGGGGKTISSKGKTSGDRVPGEKRQPEELDRLASEFAAFVGKNPGLRIEQINAQLGTKTRELALPIRKLIAEKRVKTKGEKRATTYFAT